MLDFGIGDYVVDVSGELPGPRLVTDIQYTPHLECEVLDCREPWLVQLLGVDPGLDPNGEPFEGVCSCCLRKFNGKEEPKRVLVCEEA